MALELKKEYATDREKEIEGSWEDFGDECFFLIARVGNPRYVEAFRRISKPYTKALRRQNLKEEIAERLMNETYAEAIILDWKNLMEDGKMVPYSKENCIRILTEYRDLKDQIVKIADSMETYRTEFNLDSEKNSNPESDGS